MQSVSTLYRNSFDSPYRNETYIRIRFGITNTNAPNYSTLTDNGHLDYSAVENVDLGVTVTAPYATSEYQRTVLNGAFKFPTKTNPIYQGYISDEISDANGEWTTNPQINIVFSQYVQFGGLSFQFDNNYGWFPESFQVEAYNNGVSVFNETYSPNNEYFVIEDDIPACDNLVLTWLKNNKPYSYARLLELIYGVVVLRTQKDIVSCSLDRSIDLLSTSFPQANFAFTIFDPNGEYNPENPQGVWEYLEERQPVQASIGYDTGGGNIEWMPWANTYTNGNIQVSGTGAALQVTINAVGLVNHLTMTYDEGKYYPAGRSLFDLAQDVMTFAGFPITLDNSLASIISYQPLPVTSVNNLLQLIANAGCCVLDLDRGGIISILPHSNTIESFSMVRGNLLNQPTTTKIPPLRTINFTYNELVVSNETYNAIERQSITASGTYTFTHDCMTNHSITVSSGLTYSNPQFFAYKTVVDLSGTGIITISGNKVETNANTITKTYNAVGADLDSLKNDLITDATTAEAYIDWIATETERRNTYTAPDRGYPELDVGDNIGFTSTFLNDIDVTLIQQKTTYNGALKGEGTYLIMSGE